MGGQVWGEIGAHSDAGALVEVPEGRGIVRCGESVIEVRVGEAEGEVGREGEVGGDEEVEFERESEEVGRAAVAGFAGHGDLGGYGE